MSQVTLLEGIFKTSQEKGKEYLLFLDVDRLVAPCYEAASLPPKKPRYGGWESTPISGHSIGHFLSAAASMYKATKDQVLLEKVRYAVEELAFIQSKDEKGYVSGFTRTYFDSVFTGNFEVEHFSLAGGWVPWYSLHKIFAGLIDVYVYMANELALEVVTKLADWAKRGTDGLNDEQFQRMLICEHGGMNEALADLYTLTNRKEYLDLAIRFCHAAILEPLAEGKDELEGKHANTQIPKVIGAAKLYELTHEDKYRRMATFFWDLVTEGRSYIIGGNSIEEHFGPINKEKLGITSAETCNTYNMLKLTEHLYNWTKDIRYQEYYERALYNHILASQDPDSGMKTYFVSTQPGHFKVYCSPENSFWCCTGTGMENPARYTRNIYLKEGNVLFINLFIPTEFETNDGALKLRQLTSFPESEQVTILFEEVPTDFFEVKIRISTWLAGPFVCRVNGEVVEGEVSQGYFQLKRVWNKRDQIEFNLPLDLHLYHVKGDPYKKGIMYGPLVLAGALGTENFPESDILEDHLKLNNHKLIEVPTLVTNSSLSDWIKPVEGKSLHFRTAAVGKPGDVSIALIPFYELHHQRYSIYWNIMSDQDYQRFVDDDEQEFHYLRSITVDSIQPGEQQPEIEHQFSSKNSQSGYLNVVQRRWRDARDGGYFSYQLKVERDKPMFLLVTYYGRDKDMFIEGKRYDREFELFVDDVPFASQTLNGEDGDSLYQVCYEIPLAKTQHKESINVKFEAKPSKVAGGVYGLAILNSPYKINR